jgi:zinc protease
MANKTSNYRHLLLLGLLFLVGSVLPVGAQTPPDRERLLNGLTIFYSRSPGDGNVLLKLRVQSGAAFDLGGRAGMMALLGDAFFPEAETREYVKEQLGGKLEVATSYDAIDVTLSGQANELERMVEMIRNAIVTTNLSAENVTALREARIKALSARPATASDMADRAVAVRLFGTFPYANPAQGSVESLAKVDRPDLMMARDRFLHADNATLVVIGGVEKPRVMRAVRQLLGPWQKGDRTVPATFRQPSAPDSRVLIVNQPESKSAEIRIAVRGLARSDQDSLAATLLAGIVRERWQAAAPEVSAAFARHEAHGLPGIFVIGGSVPAASASKSISAAQEVIRTLAASGPNAAELERARTLALSDLNKQQSPTETLADQWLDAETYKLSTTNAGTEISRTTAADVQRAAARLFKDAPQALVAAGNAAELKSRLGTNVENPSDPKISAPTTRKP